MRLAHDRCTYCTADTYIAHTTDTYVGASLCVGGGAVGSCGRRRKLLHIHIQYSTYTCTLRVHLQLIHTLQLAMYRLRLYRRWRHRLARALTLPSMLASAAAAGMHMHMWYICILYAACSCAHVSGYMPKLQQRRRCDDGGIGDSGNGNSGY